jgi:hypothetical protein
VKKLLSWASKNIILLALACLTLGLAPYSPEPHLWGKLKWIAGGAKGMQLMDWFDFLLHATPWVLLVLALIGRLRSSSKSKD